jgi:glycosyltransferase involved in cell wall biosynthesis
MGSNRTKDNHSLLIVQVEPPQREDLGDYYYRTYAPGIAMAKEEGVYVINVTNVHRKKEKLMRRADVLILKNICDPDMFPLIKERKQQKKLTVYELADDICAIPSWNPVYFFYKNKENLLLSKRLAHYSDSMQFSVPELRRIYGYLSPTTAVFLNQISIVPSEKKVKNRPDIIVGWGGSHGHLEDMAEISKPLIDWIISRDNVRLFLMCSDPIWSLFERMPLTRKRRFKTGSLSDYYAFLKKIDIGLSPLKDTAFNRSRSDVKFLEYAIHGVVPVVQASVPYVSTVKHGKTGFLFEDVAGLLDVLGVLTENLHLISKVAKAARDYVIRERLQHQHAKERTEYYRTTLQELQNGLEVSNGPCKIFEDTSNIEGASRNGRHLRLMPTRFENLLHDGLVLGQLEGKIDLARSLFSEASRLEPKNYLPYLFGASYSGDTEGWLRKAIERNPHSLKSLILLGKEYTKKRDIVRAINCFESAAEIFPEYEIPYLRTTALLEKMGHQKESKYLAQKAEALIFPLLSLTEGLSDNKELAREP